MKRALVWFTTLILLCAQMGFAFGAAPSEQRISGNSNSHGFRTILLNSSNEKIQMSNSRAHFEGYLVKPNVVKMAIIGGGAVAVVAGAVGIFAGVAAAGGAIAGGAGALLEGWGTIVAGGTGGLAAVVGAVPKIGTILSFIVAIGGVIDFIAGIAKAWDWVKEKWGDYVGPAIDKAKAFTSNLVKGQGSLFTVYEYTPIPLNKGVVGKARAYLIVPTELTFAEGPAPNAPVSAGSAAAAIGWSTVKFKVLESADGKVWNPVLNGAAENIRMGNLSMGAFTADMDARKYKLSSIDGQDVWLTNFKITGGKFGSLRVDDIAVEGDIVLGSPDIAPYNPAGWLGLRQNSITQNYSLNNFSSDSANNLSNGASNNGTAYLSAENSTANFQSALQGWIASVVGENNGRKTFTAPGVLLANKNYAGPPETRGEPVTVTAGTPGTPGQPQQSNEPSNENSNPEIFIQPARISPDLGSIVVGYKCNPGEPLISGSNYSGPDLSAILNSTKTFAYIPLKISNVVKECRGQVYYNLDFSYSTGNKKTFMVLVKNDGSWKCTYGEGCAS